MYKCFTVEYYGKPFELFGLTHITVLTVLAVINTIIIAILKTNKSEKVKKYFRYLFALFICAANISFFIWSFFSGYWSVKYTLPLHICDVSVVLSVIMLVLKNYAVYEITYFWGLAGSTQAILTPDIAPYNFPHYIFFSFFILHGVVITSVLYMTIVEGYRPRFASAIKALIYTHIYACIIAVVNVLLDSNYLFLCRKPYNPSIIDYLGPWPWYLLSLDFIAVILFLLYYLPFAIPYLIKNKT
ncbi:MAG: TIGR02206 family membrane protein [Acetivibrionales bacterium]|jgi:hypothetical integral membrane protein (TIGR02206 family)